jgi:hypothetical protein
MLSGIANSKWKSVKNVGQQALFTSAEKNPQVAQQFMQNPVIKTYNSPCKNCKGSLDLQICYAVLVALWLQKFEKSSLKQSRIKFKQAGIHACARNVTPHHAGLRHRTHAESAKGPLV